MDTIRDILNDKLHGNDIFLIEEILSYLDKCFNCEKMDICKDYVIMSDDDICIPLCYNCMVELMTSHISGRSGVVPKEEYFTRWKTDKKLKIEITNNKQIK